MATPILRGDDNPQLQKKSYSYDWSRGTSYNEEWKGINPDKMIAKWNGTVYSAMQARMTIAAGVADLSIEWAAAPGGGSGDAGSITVTQDRWETPEPRVEKDIFTHPAFLAIWIATGVTDLQLNNVVATMRRYAESSRGAGQSLANENDLINTLTTYYASISHSMPSSTPLETAMRYYRLYVNDQTHYQAAQYACRHTTTAPNYWSLNRADLNVNRVYSPALFVTEVTDGSLWRFPLPGRLQYKLAAAVTAFGAVTPVRSNYLIGYLKGPSAEATVARGRVEIQTSYVLDQWSTDLYPVAT